MLNLSIEKELSCSFCHKSIAEDCVDVMEFHFHKPCADKVARMLGHVKVYNRWRTDQHLGPSPELTI
jgi:hypothetical protein